MTKEERIEKITKAIELLNSVAYDIADEDGFEENESKTRAFDSLMKAVKDSATAKNDLYRIKEGK